MPSAPAAAAVRAAFTGSGLSPPRALRIVATWSILTPRRRGRGSAIGLHLSATWLHRLNGSQFRRQAVRIISREIQRHEWKERHAQLRFSRSAVDQSSLAAHYAARPSHRFHDLNGGKASGNDIHNTT